MYYSLNRRWLGLALAAAALCCPACGGGRPPVYPASGQVFVGQHPAKLATVTLVPVKDAGAATGADQVRPTGKVDEQGNFKLTTFTDGDGAPEGEYKVTVVWYVATRPSPTEDPVPVNY